MARLLVERRREGGKCREILRSGQIHGVVSGPGRIVEIATLSRFAFEARHAMAFVEQLFDRDKPSQPGPYDTYIE